jgi:hypothetical protein
MKQPIATFLQELKPEHRSLALTNLSKSSWAKEPCEFLSTALSEAFCWETSPEKYKFWYKIHYQLEEGTYFNEVKVAAPHFKETQLHSAELEPAPAIVITAKDATRLANDTVRQRESDLMKLSSMQDLIKAMSKQIECVAKRGQYLTTFNKTVDLNQIGRIEIGAVIKLFKSKGYSVAEFDRKLHVSWAKEA